MKKKVLVSVDVSHRTGSFSLYDVDICDIAINDKILTIPSKEKGYIFAVPLDELKSLRIYGVGEHEE